MLRSALLAAVFLLPSAAMADKIVSPDGDSYIEVESSSSASSLFEALSPVASAQAQGAIAPPASVRPAFPVPEMSTDEDIDQLMKPDYSAESFKLIQANPDETPALILHEDANRSFTAPSFKDEM